MKLDTQKQEIFEMLQKAVEIEFSTIPPYLTAALSILPTANRASFSIIHSVYMEEMLHLVLAGNTLMAMGGKPKFGKENIPHYPLKLEFKGKQFRNREFTVSLMRFSPEAIQTFMKIELPDYMPQARKEKSARMVVEGYTIGEFYNSIKTKITDMCREFGEKEVFSGDITHQIPVDFYWSGGGKPIKVHDLDSALAALDVIIEQGEGTPSENIGDGDDVNFGQEFEVAHYFRFNEILVGKKYKEGDSPFEPPTGDDFPVDFSQVYPIKTNCTAKDFEGTPKLQNLNYTFNRHYTMMLKSMEKAFSGSPKELYPAIMNDMHGMAQIAFEMAQIPIAGDPKKQTGFPTFDWVDLPV